MADMTPGSWLELLDRRLTERWARWRVFDDYYEGRHPLAFTTSESQLVLPVGIITTLIKGDVFNWGQIMTGALLGAAPPLIIYAFLMDYYIAGLTAGATKG